MNIQDSYRLRTRVEEHGIEGKTLTMGELTEVRMALSILINLQLRYEREIEEHVKRRAV